MFSKYFNFRFDVFKLGVSGLEKSAKEDAQTALAIRSVHNNKYF